MNTGTKIRCIREKKRLSQVELAFLVGVSQVTIGNWEKGKSIKHDYIMRLAHALEVSTDFLLEENHNANFELKSNVSNHFIDDLNKKIDFIINRFQ